MRDVELFVGDLDALLDRLAEDFSRNAARAMDQRGLFAVALPGGSVAVHGFPALAALPLDWNRTHLFWVDERAVPSSDPESNFGLASTTWLTPAGVPSIAIHRMPVDSPDLTAAALGYSTELTRILGTPPRLDFVLLGVGPDGHVASLFPNHAALFEEQQLVVPVLDAPKPPARRLTLTMPVLTGANRLVLMALGGSKAAAMSEAIGEEDSALPVSRILRRARRSLVLLDDGAAARM